MFVILPLVLTAAIVSQSAHSIETPHAQAQAPAATSFDQTVNVTRGMRFTVNNQAGEVVMRTWDRDAVKVTARHSARGRVNLRTVETGILIGSSGMGAIDYDITVPTWMPVKITGHYNYIELNGMGSEVSAENVRGDIDIKGGRGFITAKSIEGKITISGSQGKIVATAVNEDVSVENATGELLVDATNGQVTLTNIRATAVEASALNGNITYTGTLADNGRYNFITHNGNIRLGIQANPNATFYVRSYEGSFSHGTVALKPQGEPKRGRRNTYVGGNGSAQVELESFQGGIRVFAAGQQ